MQSYERDVRLASPLGRCPAFASNAPRTVDPAEVRGVHAEEDGHDGGLDHARRGALERAQRDGRHGERRPLQGGQHRHGARDDGVGEQEHDDESLGAPVAHEHQARERGSGDERDGVAGKERAGDGGRHALALHHEREERQQERVRRVFERDHEEERRGLQQPRPPPRPPVLQLPAPSGRLGGAAGCVPPDVVVEQLDLVTALHLGHAGQGLRVGGRHVPGDHDRLAVALHGSPPNRPRGRGGTRRRRYTCV